MTDASGDREPGRQRLPKHDPWPENAPGKVRSFGAKGMVERPRTERENIETAEKAYRRGYQQGAHSALEELAELLKSEGRPLPAQYRVMREWVGVLLHKWRYGKDRVSAVPPPAPKRQRQQRQAKQQADADA